MMPISRPSRRFRELEVLSSVAPPGWTGFTHATVTTAISRYHLLEVETLELHQWTAERRAGAMGKHGEFILRHKVAALSLFITIVINMSNRQLASLAFNARRDAVKATSTAKVAELAKSFGSQCMNVSLERETRF
jgi:hypothetical protein